MGVYDVAKDLLSAPTQEARIELLLEQNRHLQEGMKRIREENTQLKARLFEAEEVAAQVRSNRDFLEHGGILWRKSVTGFERFPYCPTCRIPMTGFPPHGPWKWRCSSCENNFPLGERPE